MLISLKIIEDILCNQDNLNKEVLLELLNNLIEEQNLNKYVTKLNIYEKSKIAQGTYYPSTGELNIYLKSLKAGFYGAYGTIVANDSLNEHLFKAYSICVILHELEHAKQTKIAKENYNKDSLSILASEGIEFGSRIPKNVTVREKLIYTLFYRYILTEHNAEATAIYNILKINEQIDVLRINEIELLKYRLINTISKGYNINMCPAEIYYFLRGKMNEYKEISFNEDYSEFERLSWGMPISKFMYNNLLEAKKRNAIELILKY